MIPLARNALLVVALLLTSVGSPASAMDTKAAGKCVALGVLNQNYKPKAIAILGVADRTGYLALVNQRVQEEMDFLAANKGNESATGNWITQAIRACNSF